MNKFNRAYKEFIKEVKTEAWSDYLKNVKDQLHSNTPMGLKALTYGTYDFDRAELNQKIVIPNLFTLKELIKSKRVDKIGVVGELEPSQYYMFLGDKNDVNNKNYIEFVQAIDKLNKEAARRFSELYPFLDQTKANNIEIKSSIGKGVIYVQDFGGEIYAGFEE